VTTRHGGGHTLGVAIEIPQPFGRQLDEIRARFSPDDGDMPAHVTILAPVDVDADAMDAVVAHLSQVAATTPPFRLVLSGSGSFRPVSPVVFVAVSEGFAALEQLERRVRSGDLAVETRFPYHPHVTIAHDAPEADLDRAMEELADFRADMQIGSMGVRENIDGVWQPVRTFALGG